jgi:hypothetical protein
MLFIFFTQKPQEHESIFEFNNCMIDLLFQWDPDNWNTLNIYPGSDGFDWDSYGEMNFITLSKFKQS